MSASLSQMPAASAAPSLPMFTASPGLLGNLLTTLPTSDSGRTERPLPMSMKEAKARGWDELDIVFITGDAYIDHPSFAMAILGRVLEAAGRFSDARGAYQRALAVDKQNQAALDGLRRLGGAAAP